MRARQVLSALSCQTKTYVDVWILLNVDMSEKITGRTRQAFSNVDLTESMFNKIKNIDGRGQLKYIMQIYVRM